jgi:hypothetical protein
MERTDTINHWILSRLAEVNESHNLVISESHIDWVAACSGCETRYSISVGGGYKIVKGAPEWMCPAAIIKGKTFVFGSAYPILQTYQTAGVSGLKSGDYSLNFGYTKKNGWGQVEANLVGGEFFKHATIEEQLLNSAAADMANTLDKAILASLNANLNGLKPFKAHVVKAKKDATNSGLLTKEMVAESFSNVYASDIVLNTVFSAKPDPTKAEPLSHWIEKAKTTLLKKPETPLKEILQQLTGPLMDNLGEISHGT